MIEEIADAPSMHIEPAANSDLATAITFSLVIALSIGVVLRGARPARDSAQDYFVASRQLSSVAVFCLAAGEVYGIGTLLGFPGGIYTIGAGYGLWYMGYLLLAYPVGYFLAPRLWLAAKRARATTLPDLFKHHFSSRSLEVAVALVSIGFLIPWAQLQLIGIVTAVRTLGWQFTEGTVILIACGLAFVYVAGSGLRASSRLAVLKDGFLLASVIATGACAIYSAGGVSRLVEGGHLRITTTLTDQQMNFVFSTVIFQALGFYLIPLVPQALFSAKSSNALRKAHTLMPLYMVLFPFLIFAAYYAASRPNTLASPAHAFFATAQHVLPPWGLGIVLATATLAGLFVLACSCLAVSSIMVRNLARSLPEQRQTRWARLTIAGFLLACAALLPLSSTIAIHLVNVTYVGITQFLPGVMAIVMRRKLLPAGLLAGMVCGQVFAVLAAASQYSFGGINIGALALLLNFAVSEAWHYLGVRVRPPGPPTSNTAC